MTTLQEKDKFTLDNTIGFPQYVIDEMNKELSEDMEFVSENMYESAVRHEKFRIIQKYTYKV